MQHKAKLPLICCLMKSCQIGIADTGNDDMEHKFQLRVMLLHRESTNNHWFDKSIIHTKGDMKSLIRMCHAANDFITHLCPMQRL